MTKLNQLEFAVEALEDRTLLAVNIFAAGQTNEESMQLYIGGDLVQQWDNIGGDASAGVFETYSVDVDPDVRHHDLYVAFVNDAFDPANNFDRNLRIDAVEVNGERIESESPLVFSTGTWLPEDGVTYGYGRGEYLHANGGFQYTRTRSQFTIRARGDAGDETMALLIDDQVVASWTVGFGFQEYRYEANEVIGFSSTDRFKVAFTNDRFVPGEADRNLTVSGLQVDGRQYYTQNDDVYSTGAWANGAITPGYWQTQTLYANGYFQFDSATPADDFPPNAFLISPTTITEPMVVLNLEVGYEDNLRLGFAANYRDSVDTRVSIVTPTGERIDTSYNFNPRFDWEAQWRFDHQTTFLQDATSAQNGTYEVWLYDNEFFGVFDAAGNKAEEHLLGTFDVNIGASAQAPESPTTNSVGNVRVLETRSGDLRIIGDQAENNLQIEQVGDRTFVYDPTGSGSTTFNGSSMVVLESNTFEKITVNTKGGSDSVVVMGGTYADIHVNTGKGNDAFSLAETSRISSSLKLSLGSGQELDTGFDETSELGRVEFRGNQLRLGNGSITDLTKIGFRFSGDELFELMDWPTS